VSWGVVYTIFTKWNIVTVRFKAIGQTPVLRQQVYQISAGQRFEVVANFLRNRLRFQTADSLFLYVNSAFSPPMDETVGNLYSVSR
jgi:ubiquitin-like protein ATG12